MPMVTSCVAALHDRRQRQQTTNRAVAVAVAVVVAVAAVDAHVVVVVVVVVVGDRAPSGRGVRPRLYPRWRPRLFRRR